MKKNRTKPEPVTKAFFESLLSRHKELVNDAAALEKRFSYIINWLQYEFLHTSYIWHFQNNSLIESIQQNKINFYYMKDGDTYCPAMFIILNNEVIDLSQGIPVNWLFEDFEDTVIEGQKLYEEFIEKSKQNILQNKIDSQKFLERLNLTDKEKELLKVALRG